MTTGASDGARSESRTAQIFLSYARGDHSYVRRLAGRLAAAGLSPWYDERLTPGRRWSAEIERNIARCAAFVVVVSPSAMASAWVERELDLAERLGKPILPLQLGSTDWWRLADLQVVRVDRNQMPGPVFVDRLRDLVTRPAEGRGTETMPGRARGDRGAAGARGPGGSRPEHGRAHRRCGGWAAHRHRRGARPAAGRPIDDAVLDLPVGRWGLPPRPSLRCRRRFWC